MITDPPPAAAGPPPPSGTTLWRGLPPSVIPVPRASRGGGGWHKALVVGSVGLCRRLLAPHP